MDHDWIQLVQGPHFELAYGDGATVVPIQILHDIVGVFVVQMQPVHALEQLAKLGGGAVSVAVDVVRSKRRPNLTDA
jgi:hypothetical protein